MVEQAVLEFGEKWVELLIAAETVSRGTGPLKFLGEDPEYQNTISFDTSVTSTLPAIVRNEHIQRAWKLALTHPSNRSRYRVVGSDSPPSFETEFATARQKVWRIYNNLVSEARNLAEGISDPIMRSTRLSDVASLQAHFHLAGYQLGDVNSLPSFEEVEKVITGRNFEAPTKDSLDALASQLSDTLRQKGFGQATLADQVKAMEEKVGYLKPEEVVPLYEKQVQHFTRAAAKLLDLPEGYLQIEVRALKPTENKTGSFEYEGNGKAITSIRVSDTTTAPKTVYLTAHEMTHLVWGVMTERFFDETGDLYAATGTMGTSAACLNEGLSEKGNDIYREVVDNALQDHAWVADIFAEKAKLVRSVIDYACREAFNRLYFSGHNPLDVQHDTEQLFVHYGIDKNTAQVVARGLVDINRQHKNVLYTPFYGSGRQIVEAAFTRFGTFSEGFSHYSSLVAEKGPLTAASFAQAMQQE